MDATSELQGFARIYQTDLVYVSDCWKLCGDAHCCSFSRYKSRFRMLAQTPFQELPLLPGEFQFLEENGWLEQFQDYEHKVVSFELGEGYRVDAESIISRRPGCACDHATRPTICRLYPLLPVLDLEGRFVGTEVLGIYEEMERIEGLEPACKLTSLPFDQMNGLLAITSELARDPNHLFHLEAYRRTKNHVAARLQEKKEETDKEVFSLFERAFIRRQLTDAGTLMADLLALARRYRERYGDRFQLPAMGD